MEFILILLVTSCCICLYILRNVIFIIISHLNSFVFVAMEAYVAIEGFTLPSGFVLKELAVIYANGEYDHHLFAPPPCEFFILTDADKRTIRYTTGNLSNCCCCCGTLARVGI